MRAVVIPAHPPTVAQARLEVAAPLVQPLRPGAAEALPPAFREGPPAAAPVSPAPGPLMSTPGRLAPSAGGAPPGQPMARAAVVQRDATVRPRWAPALDLPLPLRVAAISDDPRSEPVATPASQPGTIADVTPQRTVEPPQAPAPPLASVQEQATAAPAAQGAASPGGTRSEGEMEELARRLYEHIGTRLRAELLVERERAGMVTDLR
jgi:hypothetical protein